MHNAADGAAKGARITHFQALNQPSKADLTQGGTERAWESSVVVGPDKTRSRVQRRTRLNDLWLGSATEYLCSDNCDNKNDKERRYGCRLNARCLFDKYEDLLLKQRANGTTRQLR